VREAKKWNARQPAHYQRADFFYLPHYISMPTRNQSEAQWVMSKIWTLPYYSFYYPLIGRNHEHARLQIG
jgi:hypothetical protein